MSILTIEDDAAMMNTGDVPMLVPLLADDFHYASRGCFPKSSRRPSTASTSNRSGRSEGFRQTCLGRRGRFQPPINALTIQPP